MYTSTAPIPRNNASRAIAKGKLIVMAGIRLPRTAWLEFEDVFDEERSVPHTRQRWASSFTRVPQVGHNLVGFEEVSAKRNTNLEIPFIKLLEQIKKIESGTVGIEFIA